MDPRRTKNSRRLAASSLATSYFELGPEFAAQHDWRWAVDAAIWARHVAGESFRRIAREFGKPYGTVVKAIRRVRKAFVAWLATRKPKDPTIGTEIGAMFEAFANHQRRI